MKNRTIDLEDPLKETNLDDTFFVGYKESSREKLPVFQKRTQILYSVDQHSLSVIIAETGSGKTTQIPQFLVDAGYCLNNKKIAVTLPRRLAVTSCAFRVANEMQTVLGDQVGYHIRFQNKQSDYTMVKFLTDGMLINEMLGDPLLSDYSVIMVDDIHERSLNTDLVLGLLKKIRRKRKDLKLIVSSATLNAQEILDFFHDSKHPELTGQIVQIQGRQYPVSMHFLQQPCKNFGNSVNLVTKAVETCVMIHQEYESGDILVFLTGQEEIETFVSLLNETPIKNSRTQILCLPIYANLPFDQQMAIFQKTPKNTRKIVVSTNLAESSVTIDNIVFVVDSCFVKVKQYDFIRNCESLDTVPVSKQSAKQRAGRAGRVKDGYCFRLCTEADYQALPDCSVPEISRSSLTKFVLTMKSLGIQNISEFPFMTPPSEEALVRALEQLYTLKAIDLEGDLTPHLGAKLCELPLEPRLGVLFLNSLNEEFACAKEIIPLVAILSVQSLFYANCPSFVQIKAKKKLGYFFEYRAKEGDLVSFINIFLRFQRLGRNERKKLSGEHQISEKTFLQAEQICEALVKYAQRWKMEIQSSHDDVESILRCITTGYFFLFSFFMNVAQRQPDSSYKGVGSNETLFLHPSSLFNALYPEWIVYQDILKTSKYFMWNCSELDYRWLLEIAPHYYEDKRNTIIEQKHQFEVEKVDQVENKTEKKVAVQFGKFKSVRRPTLGDKVEKKVNTNTLSFDFDE